MERENRYLVLKRSDIEKYLNSDDKLRLNRIARDIQTERMQDNRDPEMECVIVERDWPMYEETWKSIEDWVEAL